MMPHRLEATALDLNISLIPPLIASAKAEIILSESDTIASWQLNLFAAEIRKPYSRGKE